MSSTSVSPRALAESEHEHDMLDPERNRWLTMTTPGWLVSLIAHVAVLILLGICYFDLDRKTLANLITAVPASEQETVLEELLPPELDPIEDEGDDNSHVPTNVTDEKSDAPSIEITEVPIDFATGGVPLSEISDPLIDRLERIHELRGGSHVGDGFRSRSAASRSRLVRSSCGSETSEAAVAMALKWLSQHQRPDGSWDFDHRHGPCKTNAGTLTDARNGATGLVLLTFLGAGQTHQEGDYRNVVRAGLGYLVRSMKITDNKLGDLSDAGNLYSHGLCAIALSEAYAMTGDKELKAPAQAAIDYIAYAQDSVGGGWRYQPKQAGDTSVLGWQLMALKSGHMAYLNVPPATVKGAAQFLDSVQADSGAAYGYTQSGDSQATTAVGLLCRMYLGWRADNGAIERGVARLSELGPSQSNLYYNYYATQVVHHYGLSSEKRRATWKKWNEVMREQGVNTQAKAGAEKGSWYIPGDHGSERGGRIYCTAMSTLILEVYYRHTPIYTNQATEDDFPL